MVTKQRIAAKGFVSTEGLVLTKKVGLDQGVRIIPKEDCVKVTVNAVPAPENAAPRQRECLRQRLLPAYREMQAPPQRREVLPPPKQQERSVSLWSILRECIGKDLSRICLPVYFNEPLSVLQKTVEDLEYAELVNKVHTCLLALSCCPHAFTIWVNLSAH